MLRLISQFLSIWPWNCPNYAFLKTVVIGDTMLHFCWPDQNFFSGLWIKNQPRNLVNDRTTLFQELEITGGVYYTPSKPTPPTSAPKLYGRRVRNIITDTAQEMKFSIKDFFRKCDQIRSFLHKPYFLCSVRVWVVRLTDKQWITLN